MTPSNGKVVTITASYRLRFRFFNSGFEPCPGHAHVTDKYFLIT